MKIDDLLEEIKKSGGKVEAIKRHCKFQTIFAVNVFDYCKQTKNRDYSFNLGSAGGPAICCTGTLPRIVGWEGEACGDGMVMHKAIYGEKPKPCPHYIKDGKIIGYRIVLPISNEYLQENTKPNNEC